MSGSATTNGFSAGQCTTEDRNDQLQTTSAGKEGTASNPNSNEGTNDSPERREQIRQQETILNYYRKYLEDLVCFMRDARSESVADLVALIRSGATDEEIRAALEHTKRES